MDDAHRVARGHSPSLYPTEDASIQLPVATTDTESSQHNPASSSTSVPPAHPEIGEADCEKIPNIPENSNQDSEDIYNRFSQRKKRVIVAVVSFAALLARTSTVCLCLSRFHIFIVKLIVALQPSLLPLSFPLSHKSLQILEWAKRSSSKCHNSGIHSLAYIFVKLYCCNLPSRHWRNSPRLVTVLYCLYVISSILHCF